MDNNMYIIPANTKSGKLLFNIFRPIDLGIFCTGLVLTMIFFFAISSSSIIATIIKLLPLATGAFLCVPVANYHNILCFIKEAYLFISNRRVYLWKGWCVRSEYSEKQ